MEEKIISEPENRVPANVPSEQSTAEGELSLQDGSSTSSQGSKKKSSLLKKLSIPSSSSLHTSLKLNEELSDVLKTRDSLTDKVNGNLTCDSNQQIQNRNQDKLPEEARKSQDKDNPENDKTERTLSSRSKERKSEDTEQAPRLSSKKQSKSTPPTTQTAQAVKDNLVEEQSQKGRRPSDKRKDEESLARGETSALSVASTNKPAEDRSLADLTIGDNESEAWQDLYHGMAEWKRKRIRILNEWKATRRQLLRDWKDVKSKAFLQKLDSEWKNELKKQNETLQKEKEKLTNEWETMKANFQAFDETRVKAKQEELFVLWTQDRINILKDWESHKVDALKVWNYLRQERARLTEEHWEKYKQHIMADFERSLERAIMRWEKEKHSRENAEKERFEAMEDKRKEEWEEAKTRAIADWEMRKREALEESGKDKADALEREALNDWARLKQGILKSWQEEISAIFKDFEKKKETALEHFKNDFPDTIALEKEYRKQQRGGGQEPLDSKDRGKDNKMERNHGSLYKDIVPPSMLDANINKADQSEKMGQASGSRKVSLKKGTIDKAENSANLAHDQVIKTSFKTGEETNELLKPLEYDKNVNRLDSEFSSVGSS